MDMIDPPFGPEEVSIPEGGFTFGDNDLNDEGFTHFVRAAQRQKRWCVSIEELRAEDSGHGAYGLMCLGIDRMLVVIHSKFAYPSLTFYETIAPHYA
jgi:hypothetical protein